MAFPVTTVTGWPNKRICIAPKGRNFRGAAGQAVCYGERGKEKAREKRNVFSLSKRRISVTDDDCR